MTDQRQTPVRLPLMRRVHGVMFKLPGMITCEAFEDFILAYLDGELAPGQKRVFELHLMLCRECREYLAAYKASMSLAKGALQPTDAAHLEDVPEDLIRAILATRGC